MFIKGIYETPNQIESPKKPSLCTYYKKTRHT